MEELEVLRKQIRSMAAGTHGQLPDVRTVMGRQLYFSSHTSKLFLLPYTESSPLQVTDPLDPDFGEFYSVVDIDAVDEGGPIG